jgi:hypothetical protein
MEENMSRKVSRKLATAIFVLGSVGISTSAGPVKASFISNDNTSLIDAVSRSFTPVLSGTCYSYFMDNSNQQWSLLSPVYWFATIAPNQQYVLTIIVNNTTGEVWDGGYFTRPVLTQRLRTIQPCSPPPF